MCGIAGIISEQKWAKTAVQKMLATSVHRGPDNQEIYSFKKGGVHLGHNRLSIIDPAPSSNQPMTYKQYTITFNGEIYNYIELRENLKLKGYKFKTKSDTEVLLLGWHCWQESFLQKLNGMFAFAVYDSTKQEIKLVRDRIGEKPLYYIYESGNFAFASEFNALTSLDSFSFKFNIDETILEEIFYFNWNTNSTSTAVNQIKRLGPGEVLTLGKNQTITKEQYWHIEPDKYVQKLNYGEREETYKNLLYKSVKLRMRSDVPIAILLSGGLDSSAITAIASEYSSNLSTYTITFNNKMSEEPFARLVSDRFSTQHEELHFNVKGSFDSILSNIKIFDDLSSLDGGLITTSLITEKVAKNGVKVLLVGEGSDEINGGYGKYMFTNPPFSILPNNLIEHIYFYCTTRQKIGTPEYRKGFLLFKKIIAKFNGDMMQRLQSFDIGNQLPNHLLMKVDKATMQHSVEARVPFLDHELATFALSVKSSDKVRYNSFNLMTDEKVILKKIMEPVLPAAILRRKKFGMLLPIDDFVVNHKQKIREYVNDTKPFSRIERLSVFHENLSNNVFFDKQNSWQLWRILIVGAWLNHHKTLLS